MTGATLAWGTAFLAFGPTASLLFLLAFEKAQLIIVVTTSAFAFLLSLLGASTIWFLFDLAGIRHVFLTLLLGVMFQFILRCGYVHLYYRVEQVIQSSMERHLQRQRQAAASNPAAATQTNNNNNSNDNEDLEEDAAFKKLALNDWTCGLASGAGFGGMHAIMLFGTLLASEAGNIGTLYQPSCPSVPSLVVSAINAFLFSLLDIVWMLFTFYGMRPAPQQQGPNRMALATCLVTHILAAFSTLPNRWDGGCRISFALLSVVTLVTMGLFWGSVSKIYLRRRRHVPGRNSHCD